jgi:hypothetical protein
VLAGVTGTATQITVSNGAGSITLATPQDIHTGASNFTVAGLTVSDLTQGSVVFTGSGGGISQDNSNLFWDDTNNRLGIGINTGFFPATGLTVSGEMDILHTASVSDDHALEISINAAGYGDVKAIDIDYTTGAISAGEDEAIILVNIDEIDATGGDVFGLEILATDGSAGLYGLKTGALVGPIHQDSGTFANPTTGTDNTTSTDVAAMIDGNSGTTTAIFENNSEYILIGAAAAFEEIEFIITTGSSGAGIKPKFEYSTAGSHQFTEFSPVDGTNGFRNTGIVAWDASDLTSHGVNTDTSTYDIKITRQRASLTTSPILGYAKTAATTEYLWDKNGDVNINNLTLAGNIELGHVSDTTITRASAGIIAVEGTNVMLVGDAATAHALLDGGVHNDTAADAVTRGSIIYGNATPKWDELVVGADGTFLGSDGTDLSYRTINNLTADATPDTAASRCGRKTDKCV